MNEIEPGTIYTLWMTLYAAGRAAWVEGDALQLQHAATAGELAEVRLHAEYIKIAATW